MEIPSSFNGVSFYIRGITNSGFNHKPVIHDIVNGKYGPYIEVMGRGAEVYSVDAFVSYNSGTYLDKNLLRSTIMQKKTGYFLHPDLGLKKCACLSISISEDASRIGVIDLRLEFVVINNDHYSIGSSKSGTIGSLISKASNITNSTSLEGINSSVLGVIGTGGSIMKSISGFVPGEQTLGRFYQAGEIGSSILSNASTLSEALPLVEEKLSNITKSLGV